MKLFKSKKPNTFHYVTSVTFNRTPIFWNEEICKILIQVFAECRELFPYKLIAYVIMPDHFHTIVNPRDADISKWLQRVRGLSAQRILNYLREEGNHLTLQSLKLPNPQKRNHHFAVWQKDPSVVDLESHKFLVQKSGYIHANPVRARLIDHPAKWKFSSYAAYTPQYELEVPIAIDMKPYWTDEEIAEFVGR